MRRSRGQTLVEFALVLPIFIALIGGIVQFGMVFWAQNTLTQVVRDTGRWAATQPTCLDMTGLGTQANQIALNASLFGYTSGEFNPATPPAAGTTDASVNGFATANAMAASWVKDSDPPTSQYPSGEGCPPKDNQAVYHVIIRMNHTIPTFFPGMQYLPGLGTCTSSGCSITLSSTAQFRMEPKP
jgi:Flp pilus assembly protein TadG